MGGSKIDTAILAARGLLHLILDLIHGSGACRLQHRCNVDVCNHLRGKPSETAPLHNGPHCDGQAHQGDQGPKDLQRELQRRRLYPSLAVLIVAYYSATMFLITRFEAEKRDAATWVESNHGGAA